MKSLVGCIVLLCCLALATSASAEMILSVGDPILAIDLDGNSSTPAAETVDKGIDRNTATKYLNFGRENSGFIVTPSVGASVVASFTITTANDVAGRDPASYALYGTLDAITSTNHSTGTAEDWTLISSGTLSLPDERFTAGSPVSFANTETYTSYRMVFPTAKDIENESNNSVQFSEIQFEGTVVPEPSTLSLLALLSLGVAMAVRHARKRG